MSIDDYYDEVYEDDCEEFERNQLAQDNEDPEDEGDEECDEPAPADPIRTAILQAKRALLSEVARRGGAS